MTITPAATNKNTRQEGTLTITVGGKYNGQETSLTVTGPTADVDSWSADYLRRYHPFGYDTRIATVSEADGVKTVHATRSHSCD